MDKKAFLGRASNKYKSSTTRNQRDENAENENPAIRQKVNGNARRPLANIQNNVRHANNVSKGDGKGTLKPSRPQQQKASRPTRRPSRVTENNTLATSQESVSMETDSNDAQSTRRTGENVTKTSQTNSTQGRARSSRLPDDIDARDANEPLAVIEYVTDMYGYFKDREQNSINPAYMSNQPHINERMRAILIDWLVEVHLKFKLVPDTLYLTIALIDKYLELRQVTRQNLQLVGVTCFLLASKYEEIYPPEIRDLVYITDRAYTKEQILKMETQILEALEFKLSFPTVYCFLLRYLKAAHADKRIVQLSCYIAERMLQEISMIHHLPSTIAACAVYIARKNLNRNPWSPTLKLYTKYDEADLNMCLADINSILSSKGDLVAVHRKFSSQKFGAVATMNIDVL
mmetsp:Transcript_38275/g.50440  ORF Transcript_38275/g.50440 Transcript_38275/m.50440 type:complete len:403 (+) Transcript_38275:329-1537(+)|eukprot:CAMPEP_0117744680 /NCGR_PEP_ID=MMETSP0947-20121206/6907_1 /TAXON_ID=44440 /ORGANISM="Chattonella subsalsa, Strain CCMP2191" /LENGTH=402 /DNA_ID=CAMNT_0005561683 /DNA_START=295 /DNA_END=1500 /DNA_ORIENTATION=+